MSANPSDSATTDLFESTTHIEAVAIAGCVMTALIALVVLKFFLNICIDVVCLGDLESARRSLGGFLRWGCPRWHPRTQPDAALTDQNGNSIEIQSTLRSRSLEERKGIVASILQENIFTTADLERLRGAPEAAIAAVNEEASMCSNCPCSICLIDFEIGDRVVTARNCPHIYHRNCIVEWLGSHGTDCPNCRREMISLEALESAANTYSA